MCDQKKQEFHTGFDTFTWRSSDVWMTFALRSCYGRKAQRQESQSKKKNRHEKPNRRCDWVHLDPRKIWCKGLRNQDWLVVSIIFIFTPTWGRFPFSLISFEWVETTNQKRFLARLRVSGIGMIPLKIRPVPYCRLVSVAEMPSPNVEQVGLI